MDMRQSFDFVVIGSGPAGQKAAVQAAKAGRRVALVERDSNVGGECVHRGTIPSKTLREIALQLARLKKSCAAFKVEPPEHVPLAELLARTEAVIRAHNDIIGEQLRRNRITLFHGRARFVANDVVDVTQINGQHLSLRAKFVIVAVGSRPRQTADIPIDHEHVLDSDSILSLAWLPRSLSVLGGGVIASEYASIFASLGTKVTMIDRYERPLGFLDRELSDRFVRSFHAMGGTFLSGEEIESVAWDGVTSVQTITRSGKRVASDKMLVALGRVARIDGLDPHAAGVQVSARGLIEVDECFRTANPAVYAVGDVVGPPSLASCSMEQGRRAVCHALGRPQDSGSERVPMGIYTIPEISSIGLNELEAREKFGDVLVGRADFDEIARGQISGSQNGFLKMVADADGRKLLGVQILGDGATEIIHIAQMGLLAACDIDTFVDNTFNFPTLAEAYRVAALQIVGARHRQSVASAAADCV